MKAIMKLGFCVASFVLLWGGQVAADVIADLPQGRNYMVTFDGQATQPPTLTPITYSPDGAIESTVTFTTLSGFSTVIDPDVDQTLGEGMDLPGGPLTRFVNSPLLATLGSIDYPLIVQIDFTTPTRVFGFGLGYNDLEQPQDGSPTLKRVGLVELYDETDDVIGEFPLYPTRLFCCTEIRFDYSQCDSKSLEDEDEGEHGLVATAVINFDYDYTPFEPATGEEGETKFMGLDNLTYSTAPPCEDEHGKHKGRHKRRGKGAGKNKGQD